jgi:predicted lipid-binding transport protein (Tim44 family)
MLVSVTGIIADTGNNNDYSDIGSGGDYGGGGDGDGIASLIFWLIFSALPWPLKLIIVIAIVVFGLKSKTKRKSNRSINQQVNQMNIPAGVKNNASIIEPAIKAIDPLFSTNKFLTWTEEVFMTLQQAWTARDWSKIRPFEKEELYRKHEMQLQEYINLGTINVMERINVNQTYLHKYVRDSEYEYLTVLLSARMNDYIINEKTREVVKGDPNREFFTDYLLTFMRKKGVLTDPATSNLSTKSCPHCGAPVAITSAGKCEYCDFIVTTGEHDWVLSDLDSVKHNTYIDNSGVIINE